MHQFPIVLIPSTIQQAKSAQPPVPQFREQQPQAPDEEPKKLTTTVIAVEAAAATVPSVVVATRPHGVLPGLTLFLAAAGVIAAQAWQQITTYPQRKREHDHRVATYSKKLEVYNRKKRQHETEVKAARSPKQIAEFRYKLLLNVLSQTIPNDGTNSKAQKGWSENEFCNHLNRYFHGKIYVGLTLSIPGYNHPYTPDFAYIDQALNLHIDIEIDEAYTYKGGEPTHYQEAQKDKQRNLFFLDRGWIVIRFSEEQVVRCPCSCCKTVAQAIASVLGDSSMLNQFANVPDLQPMKQWTEDESRRMAASRYRDKYCR